MLSSSLLPIKSMQYQWIPLYIGEVMVVTLINWRDQFNHSLYVHITAFLLTSIIQLYKHLDSMLVYQIYVLLVKPSLPLLYFSYYNVYIVLQVWSSNKFLVKTYFLTQEYWLIIEKSHRNSWYIVLQNSLSFFWVWSTVFTSLYC